MTIIWKYPLAAGPQYNGIDMPEGARILCVYIQDDVPTLWAVVDPKRPPTRRHIFVLGTNMPMRDVGLHYIGSVQLDHGDRRLVWHVFETDDPDSQVGVYDDPA